MLAPRIIPCLDVRGGRVVKGVRFENLRDVGDPAELACRYEADGADEIVFLDITATIEERDLMRAAVTRTAQHLFIPLTVGGGIRTFDDVRDSLRAGADKVALNTAALERPELIAECSRGFGAQCVVVAVDSRGGRVFSRAGTTETGRDTIAWAREAADRGAGEILLTSIDADGTTAGYDLELTRRVADAVPVPVIASGGCGSAEHIHDALTRGRAAAALAASIFHFRTLTVRQVKDHLRARGLIVREAP